MHKREIEWRIGNVKRNIAECNAQAEKLANFPDSVYVYQAMAKAADRSLASLELQLRNAERQEFVAATS